MRNTPPRKWRSPAIASRATARQAFLANVRASIEQIAANASGAFVGRDPQYLHQLRMGMRRLRAVLRAFRELVRRREAAGFDLRLRRLLRAFGATRDWDVFCQTQESADLLREARRRRDAAHRAARRVMASAEFRNATREVHAWARRVPWRSGADPDVPVAALARRALRRLHNRLRRDAADIDWRDARRRHKVRIRLKQLRYGSQSLASGFRRREMRPFLNHLGALQEVLGKLNDIDVQKRLLRKLARGGGRGNSAHTALTLLAAHERALIAELGEAWKAFESHRPFFRRRPGSARAPG